MKVILSPAKKLDNETEVPVQTLTIPNFRAKTEALQAVLKAQSPAALKERLGLSEALASLNWSRNQAWHWGKGKSARAALFTFAGEVYRGLDAYHLKREALDYLQDHLYILSGLYGLLRPFDAIGPYRLEMGSKLGVGEVADLYAYWRETLTAKLQSEMRLEAALVNLASREYSKAIDCKALGRRVIDIVFKDYKDGVLKTVMVYTKRARGLMLRYMATQRLEEPDGLKGFAEDGYAFTESLSEGDRWVFTR